MMTFERLDRDAVDWKQLDALPDRTVYQTWPWLDFIARAQNAEPVVAVLREGNDALAYFTGLIVKSVAYAFWVARFRDGRRTTWGSTLRRTCRAGRY
jgi:hypothetical protein